MTTVVSVRFRSGCKTYFFDPRELTVEAGQDIIVETAQGPEFAQCSQGNHEVPDQQVVQPLRAVLRIATDNDRHTAAYNRGREKEAFEICQKKIAQHKLEMKLVRVECSFDGSKILFFFTADGRVDFRELVKDLAGVFRARIELRQIGVRDEAKMLGGLGICGRPFCCAQFMDEFLPVSIKMAKTQSLSLNPTKISGTCGRLMCCLKYEQDAHLAVVVAPGALRPVVQPDVHRLLQHVDVADVAGAVRRQHKGVVLGHALDGVLIGVLLVFQAAHQPSAGAGDLGGVQAQALGLGHLDGHRQELVHELGAAEGSSADAQSADHLGLVPHADLPQLDAGAEHAGQILHQLTEVHPPVGGKEEQDLAAVKAALHPHQLHLQLVLLLSLIHI